MLEGKSKRRPPVSIVTNGALPRALACQGFTVRVGGPHRLAHATVTHTHTHTVLMAETLLRYAAVDHILDRMI